MSVWSGLAAAGVAITIALVAFGQPVWEYQRVDSVSRETWDYRPFSAGQTLYNNTTGVTTFRNYTYDQLAGLPSGRAQPHMAKVFADYQSFMTLALIAGAAGIALGIVSKWRKLRGIFAGIAFLVAAAPILYTIFTIAFAIPDAATSDVSSNIREFSGSIRGTVSEVWGQRIGWYLPMGSGLAFAWASSDLWHVREIGGRPCEREAAAHRQVPADPLSPHLAHGTADRAGELPDIRTHVARRRVWNGEGDREDGVQNRRRRGEESDAREDAPKLPPLGDDAEGDAGRSRDESQGHEALIVGEDLRHVRLGPPGRQPGELVVRVVAEGRHTGRVVVKRLARAEGPVVPCLPGHRIHPLVLPHGLAEGDQGDGDGYARCGEARPDGHGCKNEAADRLRGLPRGYRL